MYVIHTVYKYSDITYSTILMPSLRVKKSLFDIATLYSFVVYWLVSWQPKLTTVLINTLAIT